MKIKPVLIRLAQTAAAVVLLSLILIGYAFLFGGCAIRSLLGVPCPSCGMTRAAVSLLELNFAHAFHYHPLVFWIVPLGIFISVRYIAYGVLPTSRGYVPAYAVTLVLFTAVWLVRLFFFPIP